MELETKEISLADMIAQRGNLEFALEQIKIGNFAVRYHYKIDPEDERNYKASLEHAKQVLSLEFEREDDAEQIALELERYITTLNETIKVQQCLK